MDKHSLNSPNRTFMIQPNVKLRYVGGGRIRVLDGDLKGFVSDGANIPRLLLPFMPRLSNTLIPAIMHDWGYTVHSLSRKKVDTLFLQMLIAYEVPKWKSYLMYLAVRCFGGSHWKAVYGC